MFLLCSWTTARAIHDRPLRPLHAILEGLRRTIAAHASKHWVAAPIIVLLWGRLHRTTVRFASLVARFQAGKLDTRKRPAGKLQPAQRDRGTGTPRKLSDRLPSGFAWLVRLAQETAIYGSQLQHLLTDPDMAEFLAAAPQAGRILRPLCRMLAIELLPDTVPPPPNAPPPPGAFPFRPVCLQTGFPSDRRSRSRVSLPSTRTTNRNSQILGPTLTHGQFVTI